jgi:hypothetical protein
VRAAGHRLRISLGLVVVDDDVVRQSGVATIDPVAVLELSMRARPWWRRCRTEAK